MKVCGLCKQELPLDSFGVNRGKYLQSYCKPCKVQWDKAYYKKNSVRRDSVRATNERIRKRNRDYIWQYLSENPCVDCGEADPVVLEFDHVGDKHSGVAIMAAKLVKLERLVAEIEQCEVRCCNCHRRITSQRGKWWTAAVYPLSDKQ